MTVTRTLYYNHIIKCIEGHKVQLLKKYSCLYIPMYDSIPMQILQAIQKLFSILSDGLINK